MGGQGVGGVRELEAWGEGLKGQGVRALESNSI